MIQNTYPILKEIKEILEEILKELKDKWNLIYSWLFFILGLGNGCLKSNDRWIKT